jgi:hypothetical protein
MSERNLQPLEVFDARLVQAPLQGLLRNMDAELTRLLQKSMSSHDPEAERRYSLFLLMIRFTKNSYEAASFMCSDADDASKRKREFALLLPPTNRQLLDLLFTLVFMLDDFPTRSMKFELAGYRQAREEYDKFHERFGVDTNRQEHFSDLRELQQTMEKYLTITPEQKASPDSIAYWRAPYRLMKTPTRSQPFMEFLERWLYGETSAQAHLNPAGLFAVGGFLLTDFAPEDERDKIMDRNLEKYRFRHFSRTLATVLAIATEIDVFCCLNNREALARLWVVLGGYAGEATDVYKLRYQAMLVQPEA